MSAMDEYGDPRWMSEDVRYDQWVIMCAEIDSLRESIRTCRTTHYPECDGMHVCVCQERDRHMGFAV